MTPRVWNRRDPNCPKDAVYVGRPSKWGNPYPIGGDGTRVEVVEKFREYLETRMRRGLSFDLEELRGKDLACWCHNWDGLGPNPMYCHADVLLELANRVKP